MLSQLDTAPSLTAAVVSRLGSQRLDTIRSVPVFKASQLCNSRKRILSIRVYCLRLLGETKPCEWMEEPVQAYKRRCMLIALVGRLIEYSTMGQLRWGIS